MLPFRSSVSCLLGVSCLFVFFFNDTATTEIYTLSLHDALPISRTEQPREPSGWGCTWLKSSRDRWRSEEHTSELQSRGPISYAFFCLKKKKRLSEQCAPPFDRAQIRDAATQSAATR